MKAQMQKKSPVSRTHAPQKKSRITEDRIQFRAYEIFLERGKTPGADLEDWLKAERELMKLVN